MPSSACKNISLKFRTKEKVEMEMVAGGRNVIRRLKAKARAGIDRGQSDRRETSLRPHTLTRQYPAHPRAAWPGARVGAREDPARADVRDAPHGEGHASKAASHRIRVRFATVGHQRSLLLRRVVPGLFLNDPADRRDWDRSRSRRLPL